MAAQTLFVTGTDTEVGKTRVASALLRGLVARGERAVGYKPVASGCQRTSQGLRNDDALALMAAGMPGFAYEQINPYAFEPAIAPHIAAADAGVDIDPTRLNGGHAALAEQADWVIVEGAGGWHVPLNPTLDFAGWASAHNWPVLLVVGMRLGCVNHALLSARAIQASTRFAGWVANTLPPVQSRLEDNLASLDRHMPAPHCTRMPLDPPADWALDPACWLSAVPAAANAVG